MKRTLDAIAIGIIAAALAAASGGRWLSWIMLDLSLAWIYGRITSTTTKQPK